MAILGKWSGGTTSLIPGATWAAPNALFPTQDRNDSSTYSFSSSTSVLTLPSTIVADGYLIIASVETHDTSNGRVNPQGKIVQLTGTGTFVGTPTGGYSRDNSEDRAYVRCWAFVDNPSGSSTFAFQWKRDTDAMTGGTERSEFQVIPLYYSDFGAYTSSDATPAGATTPAIVPGFTGTDGTNITISSNQVSVTGDNKRYLIFGSQFYEGFDGNRTQRWHHLGIDGSPVEAAKAYSFYRNAANDESGDFFSWLIETVTATVTIEHMESRGAGVSALQGGADVTGGTTSTTGEHSLVVLELNDSAEVFRSRDTNQSALLATTGPVDLDINESHDFGDTDSFTDLAVGSVNVVQTGDVLLGANISAASNAVANTTRWTAYAEFTVNGVEDADSVAGDYMRNNQGTQDTFGWSASLLGFLAVTAGDDVGVSVTELAGSEGGGAGVSPAGWSGFWGINLDTLEGVSEGITSVDPTEFDFDNADVDINGANFEAVIGTGAVYLSDANTLAGSANEVDITNAVNTWSDTVINLDFTSLSAGEVDDLHTLGPGQRYLIVVNDSADEYGSAALTVHRPRGEEITTSSNVTPGTVSSAELTLTGTRTGGRQEETAAQNPSTTTTDVGADGNREEVLVFKKSTGGRNVKYTHRLTLAGTVLDTYTKYLKVTWTEGGTNVALTGQSVATALGAFGVEHTVPLVGSEIATAQGTLVATLSCPLTGQEVATEQGSVGVDIQVPLSGQEVAVAQGGFVVDHQNALTGSEVATEQGTLVPSTAIEIPLVGLEVVTALGSLGVDTQVPIVGLEVSTAQGTLTPVEDTIVALTGLESATEQGAFGVAHENPLVGSEVVTEQGSLGITHDNALSGQEVGTEQGTLTPSQLNEQALVGQEVAVEQGSVGVDITVPLVGLEVAASLGLLSTDSKVGLSGQEVVTALGDLGVDSQVALLGEEVATALGILSPQVGSDVTLPITGQEIATELGTLGVINTAPGGGNEGIDIEGERRRRRLREMESHRKVIDRSDGFSNRHINVTIGRRR